MYEALYKGVSVGIFTTWTAVALAVLEIEIEGVRGWAADLPTWKHSSVLCGRKPLTGYHVALAVMMISVTLTGVVTGGSLWNQDQVPNLFSSLSVFVWVMLNEDSYWFVLNYKFWIALRDGEAEDHFGSLASRMRLYAALFFIASALWFIAFALHGDSWADGAGAWGFYLLTMALGQAYVRAAIAPLYRVINASLHDTPVPRAQQAVQHSVMTTLMTCLVCLQWAVAIGVLGIA